jgi:hypothetical protein
MQISNLAFIQTDLDNFCHLSKKNLEFLMRISKKSKSEFMSQLAKHFQAKFQLSSFCPDQFVYIFPRKSWNFLGKL